MSGIKGRSGPPGNLNSSRLPQSLKTAMTMERVDGRTKLMRRVKEVINELGFHNDTGSLDYALIRRFVVAELFVQKLDEAAITGSVDATAYTNAVNMFLNLRKQLLLLAELQAKKEKQSWKDAQNSMKTVVKSLRHDQLASQSSTPGEA